MDVSLHRYDLPGYCCRYCGEPIGLVSRFWTFLFGTSFHQCPSVRNPETRRQHKLLLNYRDLFRPGLYEIRSRHRDDPFHPLKDVELYADLDNLLLIWTATWKDGTKHEASMMLAECIDKENWYPTYKARIATISPEHAFLDDAVVAFDDSGWRT